MQVNHRSTGEEDPFEETLDRCGYFAQKYFLLQTARLMQTAGGSPLEWAEEDRVYSPCVIAGYDWEMGEVRGLGRVFF
jgi:hypothetical protein